METDRLDDSIESRENFCSAEEIYSSLSRQAAMEQCTYFTVALSVPRFGPKRMYRRMRCDKLE